MTLHNSAHLGAQTGQPQRALTRCAHLYNTGRTAEAERLFPTVVEEIMPLVDFVIRKAEPDETIREDATQVALTNIWRYTSTTGREPDIRLVAHRAVVDVWRRQHRHNDHKDTNPDPIEPRAQAARTPDRDDESIGMVEAHRYAAMLEAQRPGWGAIARCLALGMSQADTARALNRPVGTVGRNIVEMRLWLETQATR